ncbi:MULTISPECIES: hypothetical protein [unclassified Bradyrhizobium]|nr:MULTISPECIES: hypothetical protein [unclassified Bradyrhizobium]
MTERIPDMLARLTSLEGHTERLERAWQSSVDDIKAIIRSEIRDLKDEQIADLKQTNRDLTDKLSAAFKRIDEVELRQAQWNTGASVINWMIRAGIGAVGLLAGLFGAQHIKP